MSRNWEVTLLWFYWICTVFYYTSITLLYTILQQGVLVSSCCFMVRYQNLQNVGLVWVLEQELLWHKHRWGYEFMQFLLCAPVPASINTEEQKLRAKCRYLHVVENQTELAEEFRSISSSKPTHPRILPPADLLISTHSFYPTRYREMKEKLQRSKWTAKYFGKTWPGLHWEAYFPW